MLYSGHFSFDETGSNDSQRHGYFTCITSAASPEEALTKFKGRIQKIREEMKAPLFKNILAVYVEDIVEISDLPDEPVITRFQTSEGPFPKSESCSLPTSDTVTVKAFQWIPESEMSEKVDSETDSDGYTEAVPFLRFH